MDLLGEGSQAEEKWGISKKMGEKKNNKNKSNQIKKELARGMVMGWGVWEERKGVDGVVRGRQEEKWEMREKRKKKNEEKKEGKNKIK